MRAYYFAPSRNLPAPPSRQGWPPAWGKTACGLQLCQQPGPKGDANLLLAHDWNRSPKPRSEPAQRRASQPISTAFPSRPRFLQIVQIPMTTGEIALEPVHDIRQPVKVDFLMRKQDRIALGVDRISI